MEPARARAIYELMVLTAWSDGHLDPREATVAADILERVPELRGLVDPPTVARTSRERLEEVGLSQAVEESAAALVDAESRALAFRCCARILEADGRIAHEEFRVLAQLRRLFGLATQEVQRLLAPGS